MISRLKNDNANGNRTLLVVSVMLATLMQALDTTIANVALPDMQGSLSATQDQVSWVLTSYIVAAAILTPVTGWLAGRLGRRRLLIIAVGGFTVASLLCGIATGIGEMVFYRVLQGVFGASLVPISQSLLLDAFPRKAWRRDGDVGHGHHGRPDPRPAAGRLPDPELQLALGIPDQPADRHPRAHRHPGQREEGPAARAPAGRHRPGPAGAGHRRAAIVPGSRAGRGLVRQPGNPDWRRRWRSWPCTCMHCGGGATASTRCWISAC